LRKKERETVHKRQRCTKLGEKKKSGKKARKGKNQPYLRKDGKGNQKNEILKRRTNSPREGLETYKGRNTKGEGSKKRRRGSHSQWKDGRPDFSQ